MALTVKFVDSDGSSSDLDLPTKSFKTGSRGFYGNGKLGIDVGDRITVQLVDDGKVLDDSVVEVRKFSTGSYGFWVGCKLTVGADLVQYQAQAVVVNSKLLTVRPTGYLTCQCQAQAVIIGSRVPFNGVNPEYSQANGRIEVVYGRQA